MVLSGLCVLCCVVCLFNVHVWFVCDLSCEAVWLDVIVVCVVVCVCCCVCACLRRIVW